MPKDEGTVRVWEDHGVGITLGGTEYLKKVEEWREIFEKIQALSNQTEERDRKDFLDHVAELIRYWDEIPAYDHCTNTTKTTRDRISGCVFSLLVLLDGGAGPSYALRRRLCDGETGDLISEGPDISGSLHELLGLAERGWKQE